MARCCLRHKRISQASVEMRSTGYEGTKQAWTYCGLCWEETLRQKEYPATEPPHGCSPLIAGRRLLLVKIHAAHQKDVA